MRAIAPAKINLSLRVRSPEANGMHPMESLAQSIRRWDVLTMEESDEDSLHVIGADLPTGSDNLVWKAVNAVRRHVGRDDPVAMELTKRLPAAAGLGGGSSDAAAAIVLYANLIGVSREVLDEFELSVGADVPFCLVGGMRLMEGYGERLSEPLQVAEDYWVVVAVPPFELDTPGVYGAWDRLGEPQGFAVDGAAIPPSLRTYGPLVNDLYSAAVSREPTLDDWRSELADLWDRPVLLSGSGPSLFAFFADESEARAGLELVPQQARSAFAAPPIAYGARRDDQ